MGCCGKTIKQVGDITTGYARYAAGIKYEFTDGRIRTCHKCDEQTWMSKAEYALWLTKNGIKVLKNFTELEKLPNVAEVHYEGDQNSIFIKCSSGKEFQVELEDTYDRYAPVVADFCR